MGVSLPLLGDVHVADMTANQRTSCPPAYYLRCECSGNGERGRDQQ